jgi:hypothetical protein
VKEWEGRETGKRKSGGSEGEIGKENTGGKNGKAGKW